MSQIETGTWDQEPFAPLPESLHLDQCLLGQRDVKKLKGTKNNWALAQLGQTRHTIHKGQNPDATSGAGRKKGVSCAWPLHAAALRGALTIQATASFLTHPSAPILTLFKGPARPLREVNEGTCYLSSLPPAAARVPVKRHLNSSSGLSAISTD